LTLGQRIAGRTSPDSDNNTTPSFLEAFGQSFAVALSDGPQPGTQPQQAPDAWLERAIKQAGDDLMRMTPLKRMNRQYPNMKLHLPPETSPVHDWFAEPNVDVCLQYYLRFTAASESQGDEPVSILLEFLKEHPIEFQCSGWTWYAVGYIILGYPIPRQCERRARKLFSHYWRETTSPKHWKQVRQSFQMFKASQELDSPHVAHWRHAAGWIRRADERGLAGTRWFAAYAKTHPDKCTCLTERWFEVLKKGFAKAVRRSEDYPPPSAVVLEAVATEYGVSSRALAEFRADARKRVRKSQ